jgi:hypothetical protein
MLLHRTRVKTLKKLPVSGHRLYVCLTVVWLRRQSWRRGRRFLALCVMSTFQHPIPPKIVLSSCPLLHGSRQPKTGLPWKFPPHPPTPPAPPSSPLRGILERTAGHSSRSASVAAASSRRLQESSPCRDAPCGRYTHVIQLWYEKQLGKAVSNVPSQL